MSEGEEGIQNGESESGRKDKEENADKQSSQEVRLQGIPKQNAMAMFQVFTQLIMSTVGIENSVYGADYREGFQSGFPVEATRAKKFIPVDRAENRKNAC